MWLEMWHEGGGGKWHYPTVKTTYSVYPEAWLCVPGLVTVETCVRSAPVLSLQSPGLLGRKEIFINIVICDLHLSLDKRLPYIQCATEEPFSEHPVHIRTRHGKCGWQTVWENRLPGAMYLT